MGEGKYTFRVSNFVGGSFDDVVLAPDPKRVAVWFSQSGATNPAVLFCEGMPGGEFRLQLATNTNLDVRYSHWGPLPAYRWSAALALGTGTLHVLEMLLTEGK